VISGPLTETLSGRLALSRLRIDGYLDNIMSAEEGPEREDTTLRGQLAWTRSDITHRLTRKWERSEFEQVQQSTQLSVLDPSGRASPSAALNTGARCRGLRG
jgi:iron complex outermembrane receptor protein